MAPEIQPAQPGDIDDLMALSDSLRLESPGGGLNRAGFATDVFGEEHRFSVHVARRSSQIIGYVSYQPHYHIPSAQHGLMIADLYVAVPARGQRVGLRLIESVKAQAIRERRTFLIWYSDPNNTPAARLYERSGASTAIAQVYVLKVQ